MCFLIVTVGQQDAIHKFQGQASGNAVRRFHVIIELPRPILPAPLRAIHSAWLYFSDGSLKIFRDQNGFILMLHTSLCDSTAQLAESGFPLICRDCIEILCLSLSESNVPCLQPKAKDNVVSKLESTRHPILKLYLEPSTIQCVYTHG